MTLVLTRSLLLAVKVTTTADEDDEDEEEAEEEDEQKRCVLLRSYRKSMAISNERRSSTE